MKPVAMAVMIAVLWSAGPAVCSATGHEEPAPAADQELADSDVVDPAFEPEPPGAPLATLTACTWGRADCIPCVNNVWSSFQAVPGAARRSGVHLKGACSPLDDCYMTDPNGAPFVADWEHIQGIQRFYTAGGARLAFTADVRNQWPGYKRAEFGVARLGYSATGSWPQSLNGSGHVPTTDAISYVVRFATYHHAGGFQVFGNVAAIGLEEALVSGLPHSQVVFVDLATLRVKPERIDRWVPGGGNPKNYTAGNVGMARLADGRFLVAVGSSDSTYVDFYRSQNTDIYNMGGFTLIKTAVQPFSGSGGSKSYQNTQLVTQCDGALYMIGTHGGNKANLMRVDLNSSVPVQQLQERDFDCNGSCNFRKGAGIFVTPSGQLALYGTDGDNNGNDGNHGNQCPDGKFHEFGIFEPTFTAGSVHTWCGEASCQSPDGAAYISHYTGTTCNGTELYYTPYFGNGYKCRPDASSRPLCGSQLGTYTTYSYRYNGVCYANAWPSGNTLGGFARVYREP